jgi:hypothetical protein
VARFLARHDRAAGRYGALAWKPDQLPWFIGAWVGLKFAANWKRQTSDPRRRRSKDEPDEVFQGSLLSLIGNVLSFSFALATVCVTRWFSGQHPKRTLIERFGADICLPDLREEIAQCERARQMHDMCGVRYLGLTAKPAATIAGTMGSTVNVSNDRKELASRVLADWATPESKH